MDSLQRKSSRSNGPDPSQTTGTTGRKQKKIQSEMEIIENVETNIFEVDTILDRQQQGNRILYLIKWKGYPDSENTWEPKSNLVDSVAKVDQYNLDHPFNEKQQNSNRSVSENPRQSLENAKYSNQKGQSKEQQQEKGQSTEKENENNEYEIQKILDVQIQGKHKFYLIKWKGYTSNDNTWEPWENIKDSQNLLAQFYQEQNKQTDANQKKRSNTVDNKQREIQNVKIQRKHMPEHGTIDTDIPEKIILIEQTEEDIVEVHLQWLPREDGTIPDVTIYDKQTIKFQYPLLLIEFYEKFIKYQQDKTPQLPPLKQSVEKKPEQMEEILPQEDVKQQYESKPQKGKKD